MGMKGMLASSAISVCLFLLTGCAVQKLTEDDAGETEAAFSEPVYDWGDRTAGKLVVWGVYPEMERSYLKKAFARYEGLTGNELEVVQIPKAEFEQKVQASVAGKSADWDILLSYGGTNIESYDPDGDFYDFSDALWVDDLTDTSINQTIFNGKVIGLPHWEAAISGTLYNKDIFKKYHIKAPETKDEFMAACEALLQHGVKPLYLPGKEASLLLYQFPLNSIVEDQEVMDKLNSGQIGYTDIPEMEEGVLEGTNLALFLANKNGLRLDAALDFITFLADPYNYNAAFEGIYTAPVFRSQVASISTPQYLEAERMIERRYQDSTAWLRIRGFSQMDASCILEYMDSESQETAKDCLQNMDVLRENRLGR